MSWELMSYGELMSGGTNVLDSSDTDSNTNTHINTNTNTDLNTKHGLRQIALYCVVLHDKV